MNCRHFRQIGMAALAGLALVATVSCGNTATQGKSPAYLVIDLLQAAQGGPTVGQYIDYLESDVLTKKSIYEDYGLVTLHAAMKNPGADPASPVQPSSYSVITVDRYHVSFIRSDGRNQPGVDVPYAFDGAATGSVGGDSTVLSFVLVRGQAKAEAPLKALQNMGGAQLISTIAEVTFYGRDQAGNAVSITGRISVNFADWADPS